jgi:hypothetical protein
MTEQQAGADILNMQAMAGAGQGRRMGAHAKWPERRRGRHREGQSLRKDEHSGPGSTKTAEENQMTIIRDWEEDYGPEDYGYKLSDLFIDDLKDNEDLGGHLADTALLYAESPKGVRKLINAVLMRMCGITFVDIIVAAEQNTTVLKAEVEYDYDRLPDLNVVEEIRRCLDEV